MNNTGRFKKSILFLWLQIKASFSMLPRIIAAAVFFSLIAGLAAFAGTKLLYPDNHKEPMNVALVLPQDSDRYTRAAFSFINEIDTVKSQCTFLEMSEEEAFSRMQDGSVDAVILVPGQFIEHIMDGTNTPAQIILPKSGATSSSPLFRELVDAGVGDLAIAQAGIYAVDDYCGRYGLSTEISAAELYLNEKYLSHALDRSVYFTKETISSTGSLTILQFYCCTGAVLLIMLSSISCISLLKADSACIQAALSRNGVCRFTSCVCRFLSVSFTFLLLIISYCAVLMTAAEFSPQVRYISESLFTSFGPASVIMLFATLLAIFSLSQLMLSLSDNTGAGIVLLFIVTVLMLFLAGGFVPEAFLPSAIQKMSAYIPATYILGSFRGVLGNYTDSVCLAGCIVTCIIAALLTTFVRKASAK